MRIAFLSYDFPEYCIRHANEMAVEHEILLMLPSNGTEEHRHLVDANVRFETFHRPRYRQPLRQLATMIRILRRVHAYQPDVVHFQNGHLFFNLVLPLFRKFPLVITIHDPRQHLGDQEARLTPQSVMDFGFKKADRVIVHGTDLKPSVIRELDFPEHQVHVIPHIAIGERDPDLPLTDDGNTILFFGRIWEYKGLDYLIRAEPKISAEFPRLRVVIAGRGEDFASYRQKMRHPEHFVIHNEWISEGQRARLFAGASAVALPYVEATQSGVIPIAYMFEKPVIATRTGGLPDLVDHGTTGLLVPPRDSDALADAVIELLSDKEQRLAMGRAGKKKLERECSPEVVVRKTLDVYRGAINDQRGRNPARLSVGTSLAKTPFTKASLERAAKRICGYLEQRHLHDGALIGPDPGVRFNYRVWRFFKSYFPRFRWNDQLYYLQGQGYWILANWMLSRRSEDQYERLALAASDHVLKRQRDDGAWDYPNPEWKGRVATVEGIWAAFGLLESYRRSGRLVYRDAALRWHAFFESRIGYQEFDEKLAVNYFADIVEAPVPNNSALALRYLANMASATGDPSYLIPCQGLLRFIREAQLHSGEIPYVYRDARQTHFQCFQYQAFLYLDLREYLHLTGDECAREILVGVLRFLKQGVSPEGFVYYECGETRRRVNYHTAAVAAALATGSEFDMPECEELADRAWRHLLSQQGEDGSIPHSRGDYRVLRDNTAYPRYLAIIMHHLLSTAQGQSSVDSNKETRGAIAHA